MRLPMPQSDTEIEMARIGVSSCLMGEKTRYDGEHQRDNWVVANLGSWCELISECPESSSGMGIPREPVHLVGDVDNPSMVGNTSRHDWTKNMSRYASKRVRELGRGQLHGFILKSGSPSCGITGAELENNSGRTRRNGVGMFVLELNRKMPWLPLIQESDLWDPQLRDHFLVRVFSARRCAAAFSAKPGKKKMQNFHDTEHYLLMSHDPRGLAKLDDIMAARDEMTPGEFKEAYRTQYQAILTRRPTLARRARVLAQILKELSDLQTDEEFKRVFFEPLAADISLAIKFYRRGDVPLGDPLLRLGTLVSQIKAQMQDSDENLTMIARQSLLNPSVAEARLRWI